MCVGCKIGIVQAPVYKVNCAECKIGPLISWLVSVQMFIKVKMLSLLQVAIVSQIFSARCRDDICF